MISEIALNFEFSAYLRNRIHYIIIGLWNNFQIFGIILYIFNYILLIIELLIDRIKIIIKD